MNIASVARWKLRQLEMAGRLDDQAAQDNEVAEHKLGPMLTGIKTWTTTERKVQPLMANHSRCHGRNDAGPGSEEIVPGYPNVSQDEEI
jgi:hypothetical protein